MMLPRDLSSSFLGSSSSTDFIIIPLFVCLFVICLSFVYLGSSSSSSSSSSIFFLSEC